MIVPSIKNGIAPTISTSDAPHKLINPNDPIIASPVPRTPAHATLYLFVTQLHVPPINARHGNIIIIINVTEKIARLSVTAVSIPLVKLPE